MYSSRDADTPRVTPRTFLAAAATWLSFGIILGATAGIVRGVRRAEANLYGELGLHHLRSLTLLDEVGTWVAWSIPISCATGILWCLLHRTLFARRLPNRGASRQWTRMTRAAWCAAAMALLSTVLGTGFVRRDAQKLESRDEYGDATPRPMNLLLISIDTLRYDALGVHGASSRRPTPYLDALAQRSVDFHQARATSSWTLPSHAALLTSTYHARHGLDSALAWEDGVRLAPSVTTLAEILRDAGYRTRAITGGGFVRGSYGLDQGFESYRDEPESLERGITRLMVTLDDLEDQPFFVFFHTYEVHAPYRHGTYLDQLVPDVLSSEERDALLAALRDERLMATPDRFGAFLESEGLLNAEVTRALYDGGVAFLDQQMGRLLEHLKHLGLRDSTMIILTSDHGDEFGEHHPDAVYDAHGHSLFDELLRVPLIVGRPGAQPAQRFEPVSLIDVMPTTLAELGVESPVQPAGRPLLDGTERVTMSAIPRVLVAETHLEAEAELVAVMNDRFKLITRAPCKTETCDDAPGRPNKTWLYDLSEDPRETRDQLPKRPVEAAALRVRLDEYLARAAVDSSSPQPLDPELAEELRALGYIE